MTTLSTSQLLIFSGILGLVIGSFLSMLTWRLPRIMMLEEEEQLKEISLGGSKCPQCDATLPWYRLIPLFSWLATKGRCHNCKTKISARYPLIEALTAIITITCMWQFGLTTEGIAATLFSWILIAIFVIDYEHQLILDNLSLPLLWLGLLLNTQTLFATPIDAIWGAAIGYLLLWVVFHSFKLLTGKEGMGYGDFKLLAALGAWFGFIALPQIILIAAVTSILISLIGIMLKTRDRNTLMAFGPFLAIAGWATLFFGPNIF
ncbi:type 4 prepilin-like proteins leader peptide-processing enzyme [Thiomicrorhabdus immobilis]|uniref:Prepilin leader peptidase/N-methyltransferase n=1 Tax=Thiomicrorhabdus immobilis TaxID=2791037 RepID=A0ABN6CX04_9GAMM|nr:A24 family peptidase [Thiomicrorhabdus immobilis]BCN93611.1 type 4 prepilin-like proteins leader peptide-processing enzyme [Thiomicrorhabdus immobilis]